MHSIRALMHLFGALFDVVVSSRRTKYAYIAVGLTFALYL